MITLVIALVFGLFAHFSFGKILTISTILSLVAFVGDLFIMPKIRNIWATVSDFALAWIGIAVIADLISNSPISIMAYSFWAALIIAGGEYFYHRYLLNHVFKKHSDMHHFGNMQTEFGEELELKSRINPDKK